MMFSKKHPHLPGIYTGMHNVYSKMALIILFKYKYLHNEDMKVLQGVACLL